jgi:RNA polymerase sigma-70 factor (ECF subfamily)
MLPPTTTQEQETPDPAQAAKARNLAAAIHDAGLVRRCMDGDDTAFTEIVQRHYARIRSVAYRVLRNQPDAEEVTQDTFIRAHRGMANFRGDCSLAVWLHCIALNLARNRYGFNVRRRRNATISIESSLMEDSAFSLADILPDEASPLRAGVMAREFVALVAECMQRLDASQREILLMRTKLNLSYEEIAVSLRVNIGTVKSRIARARECLREQLYQVAPEFGRESTGRDYFEYDRPLSTPSLALA